MVFFISKRSPTLAKHPETKKQLVPFQSVSVRDSSVTKSEGVFLTNFKQKSLEIKKKSAGMQKPSKRSINSYKMNENALLHLKGCETNKNWHSD